MEAASVVLETAVKADVPVPDYKPWCWFWADDGPHKLYEDGTLDPPYPNVTLDTALTAAYIDEFAALLDEGWTEEELQGK